jgi:hypothetical protein
VSKPIHSKIIVTFLNISVCLEKQHHDEGAKLGVAFVAVASHFVHDGSIGVGNALDLVQLILKVFIIS